MIPLGSPFRPPCGGWPTPLLGTLGSRDQHCHAADDGKPVFDNVTTHAGSPIAANTSPEVPDACDGGDTHVSLGGAGTWFNCYRSVGTTADFSRCRKLGFKNLAAAKAWQGVWPFTGPDSDQCLGSIARVPNQTRYLRRLATITETVIIPFCLDPGTGSIGYTTHTYTATQQYAVDRWSGRVTQEVCSDSDEPRTAAGTGCLSMDYQCGLWSAPDFTTAGVLAAYLNGATLDGVINSQTVPGSGAGAMTVSFSLTVNSTSPGSCGGALPPTTNTYEVSLTLSQPYTAHDLWEDVTQTMLAGEAGNFVDDAVYPWRAGGDCHLAPVLTVDEATGGDLLSTRDSGWTDPNPSTGHLTGGFVPAGYDRFFNSNQRVFLDPATPTGEYGEPAPDWCPNAKQWLNKGQGQWGSPGYWASYNWKEASLADTALHPGRLIMCLWAETILFTRPSHNFARPCGPADAAALDQPTAICTDGVLTGDLRWPSASATCPEPPATGYEWNDIGVKGQFISKHWIFDPRDTALDPLIRPVTGFFKQVEVAQQCIAHTVCCPNVAYIAPFDLAFSNGVRINPGALVLDEYFGSLDRWRVEQWMTDPLYQPPRPCPDGGSWNEDDGSCTGDYPLEPYEEALLAVPAGAPALPAGCAFIDYAGYVADRNAGTLPDPILECEPPPLGSCQAQAPGYARWLTQLTQEENCCDLPTDECVDYVP